MSAPRSDAAGRLFALQVFAPLFLNLFFAGIFGGSGDRSNDDYSLQGHFGGVAQVNGSQMAAQSPPKWPPNRLLMIAL